ncbi:MAG: LPS export ABC transporter periplasmic protein LptC [Nitrospira sp.]|nr:LPS export ABC transporter periplasmic protein LptC [Nitrospira sp.]
MHATIVPVLFWLDGKRGSRMWERVARRTLLALSAVLATFLCYLLYTNAGSTPVTQSVAPGAIEQADAKISNFTFTQSKGNAIQWHVQAREARVFERERRALLSGVDITFYGEQGKEMTVSGEEGTLDIATKNLVLANQSDPMVVETQSGYTIYTNHVAWTDATKELHTNDAIRIVGHGVTVTGRGLLGRVDSEEFQILEDVHVDFLPAS